MASRQIFVNLPVEDLDAAVEFFTYSDERQMADEMQGNGGA